MSESDLTSIRITSAPSPHLYSESDSDTLDFAISRFITLPPMDDSGAATPLVSSSNKPTPDALILDAALQKLYDAQVRDKQELLGHQENMKKDFLKAQEKREAEFREEVFFMQKKLMETLAEAQAQRDAERQIAEDKKEFAEKTKQRKKDAARDRKASDLLVMQKAAETARIKKEAVLVTARARQETERGRKEAERDRKEAERDRKEAALAAAQAKKEAEQKEQHAKELRFEAARFAEQLNISKQIAENVEALTAQLIVERKENKILRHDHDVLSKKFEALSDQFSEHKAKAEDNEQYLSAILLDLQSWAFSQASFLPSSS